VASPAKSQQLSSLPARRVPPDAKARLFVVCCLRNCCPFKLFQAKSDHRLELRDSSARQRGLKTALRVFVAEFREPEDADVEALRSYVPPFTRQRPAELACEVIQQGSGRAEDSPMV
jgi:hypothetical protein